MLEPCSYLLAHDPAEVAGDHLMRVLTCCLHTSTDLELVPAMSDCKLGYSSTLNATLGSVCQDRLQLARRASSVRASGLWACLEPTLVSLHGLVHSTEPCIDGIGRIATILNEHCKLVLAKYMYVCLACHLRCAWHAAHTLLGCKMCLNR